MNKSRKWIIAQKLERKWWRNYLKNKTVDDYLAWKRKYWNDLLAKLSAEVNIAEAKSVLDAGCGPAGIFTVLQNQAVDAVDPLLDYYETDLPHFKRSMYPQVNFISSPLENFVRSNQYDLIFCMNAINHVSDIKSSMDNLFQSLKENGTLVISIDAHRFNLLKTLFRLIPGDALHPQQFSLSGYQKMIESRGGQILKTLLLKHEMIFDYEVIVARKVSTSK